MLDRGRMWKTLDIHDLYMFIKMPLMKESVLESSDNDLECFFIWFRSIAAFEGCLGEPECSNFCWEGEREGEGVMGREMFIQFLSKF